MSLVPYVVEQTSRAQLYYFYSRLLNDRIIFFLSEVNDTTASWYVAPACIWRLRIPDKDIKFYIKAAPAAASRQVWHLRHHAVHQVQCSHHLVLLVRRQLYGCSHC